MGIQLNRIGLVTIIIIIPLPVLLLDLLSAVHRGPLGGRQLHILARRRCTLQRKGL